MQKLTHQVHMLAIWQSLPKHCPPAPSCRAASAPEVYSHEDMPARAWQGAYTVSMPCHWSWSSNAGDS